MYHTNKNPQLIGGYFLECVAKADGCPCLVRLDRGTENGHVRDFQKLLRMNHDDPLAARPCYQGKSTGNQRIESWWGILRRHSAQYWLDLFKGLVDNGDFNGDFIDKSLVQFCYTSLLQVSIFI